MGEFAGVLMAAPALSGLGRREIAAIERAGRVVRCDPGEPPCALADQDRRLFVLVEGHLEVRLGLREGDRCGGEVKFALDRPGEVLGWALLMKPERLTATARCRTSARLLAVDPARMPAEMRLSLAKRLALHLHSQLQRLGLCRPDAVPPEGLVRIAADGRSASPDSP